MHAVEIEQASQDLRRLIEAAMGGAEVVITKDHRPLVRLVKAAQPARRRRRAGSAKGLITIADDFDEPLDGGSRSGGASTRGLVSSEPSGC